MRISQLGVTVLCSVLLFVAYGCGSQPKTQNSGEAISQAKSMDDAEAQAKFLIAEAKAFINNKQYDEAMKTAKYVAGNFESSAAEAQKIIEQAAVELKKEAEKKMEEMKKKLGGIGK